MHVIFRLEEYSLRLLCTPFTWLFTCIKEKIIHIHLCLLDQQNPCSKVIRLSPGLILEYKSSFLMVREIQSNVCMCLKTKEKIIEAFERLTLQLDKGYWREKHTSHHDSHQGKSILRSFRYI